jgi:hypothetical protein
MRVYLNFRNGQESENGVGQIRPRFGVREMQRRKFLLSSMMFSMAALTSSSCGCSEVLEAAPSARSYEFDRIIPRSVLESYLSRAITMESFLQGRGDFDDNLRMLGSVGAKLVSRSICRWGGEARFLASLPGCKDALAKVRQADAEMILEACIFEIVTTAVEQIPVPAWAFEALELPVEKRNFRYADIVNARGMYRDHWGTGSSVPDVSRMETKLWFYTQAVSYIDLGIEALHFGQAGLIAMNDPDLSHWTRILSLVRTYAGTHAHRHMVLCNAHDPNGGLVREGRLLMDFHAFPMRIKEVAAYPQSGVLQMGYADSIYGRSKGGLTFSGWNCSHLPYVVELDNYGVSSQPGQAGAGGFWVWGYDEITWFAHQSPQYRSDWLRYAWAWVRKVDPNGYVEMPGARTMTSPLDKRRWYCANRPSAAEPDGMNDEATIRAIWMSDGDRP